VQNILAQPARAGTKNAFKSSYH